MIKNNSLISIEGEKLNSMYLNFDEERDEHLQSALHSIKSKLIFYEQIALKKEIVVLTLVYGMNSMAKLQ